MRYLASSVLALLAAAVFAGDLPRSASTEGAAVYIIAPADGATVSETLIVRFGLRGMGVAPAGVERAGTGHHHLLIDMRELPPMDAPLPASERLRHFGGGQTEVTLTLPPGEHTLQLVLADHTHIPHDPPVVSERITVHVATD